MKKIQKSHIALIIKYTGISFITGGLSHGFFSGERQIITSLVGVIFFIIGTLLEQKPEERDYMRTIIFSSLLAVAIGALTGGLQHFPDSPDRSVWLVPAGFLVSIFAYLALEKELIYKKIHLIYALAGFIFFIILSAILYALVGAGYLWAGEHGHGATDHHTEQSITTSESTGEENISSDGEVIDSIEVHSVGDGHTDHDH